ncbi:MAG TPA: GNAT family N-acetyltransferase [Caulobacteraceae bacterium]|jgi:ribosomal protein S18 acetylase RimI-like enzyme
MTDKPAVIYARQTDLEASEFARVLAESGLGATRPLNDPERLGQMLSAAGLVVTARLDQSDRPLVGVARCITDFSWCCYLSELAVSRSAQGLGVGKGLLNQVRRELGPTVSLILASMPDAVSFYERIGMPRMPDTFCYRRER